MKTGDKRATTEELETTLKLFKKGWSYSKIGKFLKRDHTTIMHRIKNINKLGRFSTEKASRTKPEKLIDENDKGKPMSYVEYLEKQDELPKIVRDKDGRILARISKNIFNK